jgi:hypothetical protein
MSVIDTANLDHERAAVGVALGLAKACHAMGHKCSSLLGSVAVSLIFSETPAPIPARFAILWFFGEIDDQTQRPRSA